MSPACSLAGRQRKNGDIENTRNNTSVIDKARFKVWVIIPAWFIRSNHLEMVAPLFHAFFQVKIAVKIEILISREKNRRCNNTSIQSVSVKVLLMSDEWSRRSSGL